MKKIICTLLLLGGFCLSSSAQAQNSRQANQTSSSVSNYNEKVNAVKSCTELNEQLTELFGKDYSISDPKVSAQLQKNISDKTASRCVRKKSLYGIYGEDYVNKLHLITDDNQNSHNKK